MRENLEEKRLRDKYTKRSIRLQTRVSTNRERDLSIHVQRHRYIVSKVFDLFQIKSVVSKKKKNDSRLNSTVQQQLVTEKKMGFPNLALPQANYFDVS